MPTLTTDQMQLPPVMGVSMSLSWRFKSTLGGIDVVNREIVWASGGFDAPGEAQSPGVVVRTVNGGRDWQDVTPPDGKDLIFHDVEAFDRNHALGWRPVLAKTRRSSGPKTAASAGRRCSKTRTQRRSTTG